MKKKKIMLLEDEAILAQIYKSKLESGGYSVTWVETIEEADRVCRTFEPDLVFIDYGLKSEKRNGLELIPILKKKAPNAKLIILSNYSNFQVAEKAIASGADDYLVKLNTPPKILLKYVKQLLA